MFESQVRSSTPQLPFKRPHIPTKRDQKALHRGTLGGLVSSSTLSGPLGLMPTPSLVSAPEFTFVGLLEPACS